MKGRLDIWECGIRLAVEAKRKEKPQKGSQPKNRNKVRNYVSVKQEDQPEEMRAQNTDEQDEKCAKERKLQGELREKGEDMQLSSKEEIRGIR